MAGSLSGLKTAYMQPFPQPPSFPQPLSFVLSSCGIPGQAGQPLERHF